MIEPKQTKTGTWTAQVRLPNGKRPRITEPTKAMWFETYHRLMADIAKGDWVDPRGAKTTVAEVWETYRVRGDMERSTEERHDSIWRNHVGPKWSGYPIGTIQPHALSAWREELADAGIGTSTINLSLDVLSRIYRLAKGARLYQHNPVHAVARKKRAVKSKRVLRTYRKFPLSEEEAILEAADRRFPGRLDARPFLEAVRDTAGRWAETAAILELDIDDDNEQVYFSGIITQKGERRPWLKSEGEEGDGGRTAFLSESTLRMLKARREEINPTDVVFCSPTGKLLHYNNWRTRVFLPILKIARLCGGELRDCEVQEAPRNKHDARSPRLVFCQNEKHGIPEPWPTVHDFRRTTLTEFGEEGMQRHEIEAIAGHAPGSKATAEYLVPGERRFDIARKARRR